MSGKLMDYAPMVAMAIVFSGLAPADTAVGVASEAEFERRLMGFCSEWSHEIKKMTLGSTKIVCRCLYDAAADKTSDEVKLAVNALPETAAATDFDEVYGQSSMDRAVIDEITNSAVQCLADHGVPAEES